MVHAMLFYRTLTTRQLDFATPALLYASHPEQCILFTPPNDLASKINDVYTNNIVRKNPPEPFNRFIRQTDEGVAGWLIDMEGNFLQTGGTSSVAMHFMATLPQGDSYHNMGCIGLVWPNGPFQLQEIDPAPNIGLMIVQRRGTHVGITKELVDFSVQLSYGGFV